MRCFYSEDFFLPLPPGHPFPMAKFRDSCVALLAKGVIDKTALVAVQPASDEVLLRVHSSDYLGKLRTCQITRAEEVKLGLPITPQLFPRSAMETEATRQACWAALEDGAAAVLAGGTHHAFADRGEGYCVLNDVAVAVRDLQVKRPGIKVLVVDTDAHQGNGTHALLREDPNVFCYSIHVGKNYPTTKVPGDLDVETVRYVEGDVYLKKLRESLSGVMETFKADLVIWISGADPHRNDRFGQMLLTLAEIKERDRFVSQLAFSRNLPTVLLYGGGYNRQVINTAKIHASTVQTFKETFEESR